MNDLSLDYINTRDEGTGTNDTIDLLPLEIDQLLIVKELMFVRILAEFGMSVLAFQRSLDIFFLHFSGVPEINETGDRYLFHLVRVRPRPARAHLLPLIISIIEWSFASLMIDIADAKIERIICLSIIFFVPLHRFKNKQGLCNSIRRISSPCSVQAMRMPPDGSTLIFEIELLV